MNASDSLAFLLGGWANSLPAIWRKRIYKSVKILSGLLTLALVALPLLPGLGVDLSTPERWTAVLTGILAFVGHLADTNTHPEDGA